MSDTQSNPAAQDPQEENQLILERREKLKAIRQAQIDGFSERFQTS
jgi:lysyl-tRNA synthetase, class II